MSDQSTIKYISVAGAGSKDGSSAANAWDNTQWATAIAALGPGIMLKVAAGTYNQTGEIEFNATDATTTSYGAVIGVNASTWLDDGSKFILDGGSGSYNGLYLRSDYYNFKNMIIQNYVGFGLNASASAAPVSIGCTFDNCDFNSNLDGGDWRYAQSGYFFQCESNNNTSDGFYRVRGVSMNESRAIGNGAFGCQNTSTMSFINCIFHDNATGIQHGIGIIRSCVVDDNTTGIISGTGGVCFGNKVTNNTTGISTSSGAVAMNYNYFYNNGTDVSGYTNPYQRLENDVVMSDDYYTDRANDNFNSTTDDESSGFEIDIDGTNKSYSSAAFPRAYTAPITVSDIAPASGAVGITVTITGTNFAASGNTVTVGGTSATVTSEGTTEIQFTVPSKAVGIYDVVINNGSQSLTVPNGFTVTDTAPPTFAGITQLEAAGRGTLKASWSAGSGTITSYNIYVRDGSASVFSDTYLVCKVANTATAAKIITDAAGAFLVGTGDYYVGIKAENNGTEDSNTATLNISPTGDGLSTLNEDPYREVLNYNKG